MDPKGLLSLTFLLFLSLAFERSYGTGTGVMNCPKILRQLGRNVLLPLTQKGISKSMNKSIHIIVTVATSPESSVKTKIVSLDPSKGGPPRFLKDRYKFYREDLQLEILDSRKEDEGWYSMTLEKNDSVQHFCLQLKLYEQVSTPEIKVLNQTQDNGTCTLTLACTVEKGDGVAYSWSEEVDTHPLSPANSSHLLSITLGPQHADSTYICTASNPISNSSKAIIPWSRCSLGPLEPSPQWGLYAGLFLGGVIGVVMILEVVILLFKRRGKTDHYQPTKEAKSLTIYAQVQKPGTLQKKPDPLPAQNPCTTIYVAATEPVPECVQETNPITVYASVTLPES
ncbi:signaling lymphocytic activation molecule [Microcebus murinus]|uniref:Signaling lymphocytic activation molecule family member 1 n=1 Tax=Microcebus murinus TaxID=30608 RepID=A0A8B7F9H2_MICMU|nr:signaling lymphocytic activation molecule [Microcebus murinus]